MQLIKTGTHCSLMNFELVHMCNKNAFLRSSMVDRRTTDANLIDHEVTVAQDKALVLVIERTIYAWSESL